MSINLTTKTLPKDIGQISCVKYNLVSVSFQDFQPTIRWAKMAKQETFEKI